MQNPLLEVRFQIPFDQIRAEHVEPAIQTLIEAANRRMEAISSALATRTWDNTMGAFDAMTEPLDYALSVVRHLESVATYPELRAAYNAVQPAASAFYASIPLHEGLYRAIKEYALTEEAKELTGTRKRFLTKTLDSFRRHGAELPAEGKKRLAEIDVELGTITTKFSEHVLDSTNAFELVITDEKKIAGLPPSAVEAARESARAKNQEGWRFTLQAPSYLAVMTYLDDRGVREKLYRAFNTRAASDPFDNRGLVLKILELRREKAALLGYDDFGDLVLEDRMAHTGGRALSFLEDLKTRTARFFERENAELEEYAGHKLEPWDVGYYAEKLRTALYNFDEEALRPYFPVERVMAGMFEIYSRLLAIRVAERPGTPVWDPSVKLYEIRDERDGSELGCFYADFFPRENKRGGAWMDAFLTGTLGPDGRWEPHLGLICGNLTPPVGEKPALLTHREVETIFHEFGHLLHHCLSRVEVRSLAGTSVPWDFVELPSQIMENWTWERESLDLFARHWQTGETIPQELYERMKRARAFRAANAQMRQLSFGIMDLTLHRDPPPESVETLMNKTRSMLQEFTAAPLPPEHAMVAAFTHLFASPVGYGAGYYSYKWAEVLDADAFTRFRREGVFNRDTGLQFRDHILARGDSDDPANLYRNFMGRDPDLSALLERSGLVE
jgi:oligopeptidase A